jgi:hypothetical protein
MSGVEGTSFNFFLRKKLLSHSFLSFSGCELGALWGYICIIHGDVNAERCFIQPAPDHE